MLVGSKNATNKKIWKVMIMVILSQLLLICVGFVDNIMTTHYDAPQTHYEAVAIGAEAWYFFQAFFLCLGVVFGILYAQFKDNKKLFGETIKFSIHATLVVMVVASLIMYFAAPTFVSIFYNKADHSIAGEADMARKLAINYIRILAIGNVFASISYMMLQPLVMTGKVKYTVIVATTALIANLLLDFIFIYRVGHADSYDAAGKLTTTMGLGALGAGWATVISYFIQMIVAAAFVYRKRELYRFENLFKIDKGVMKMVLKRWFIYFASVIMYISYSTITLLFVAQYGTSYIRSLTLAYMVSGIMWTMLPAVKQTTSIFIGDKLGKDQFRAAQNMLKKLFRVFFLTNLIISVVGFSAAWWVPNVMLNNESTGIDVIAKAKWAIIIFSAANFIYVFQTYYSAVLEAGGKQFIPNIFNYFAPFWTAVPTVIALGPWGAGLDFEWVFAIENAVIGLTLIVLWWDVKRNKWKVNLNKTHEMSVAELKTKK